MINLVFSDEKLFTIEESTNSQNERVYAAFFEDIPEHFQCVQHVQHPNYVILWVALSNKDEFRIALI